LRQIVFSQKTTEEIMQNQHLNGTICLENGDKICKIGVVLAQKNVIEKIIFAPLNRDLPLENLIPISENPALAKYIENAFYKFGNEFSHLPFTKTRFTETIFKKLREVPYGKTISYKELAKLCGSENAARAVGNALRNNPLPINLSLPQNTCNRRRIRRFCR